MTDLGNCRWELMCAADAVDRVEVKSLGIVVPACEEHALDHAQWEADAPRVLNAGPEPEPECWCTDFQLEQGRAAPYCPAHGTPEERGIDLG